MTSAVVRWLVATSAAAGVLFVQVGAQTPPRPPKPGTAEAVLAAYVAGDATVIGQTFKTSLDFQNRLKLSEPKEFDKWLGEYDPAKAVFVLSLAQVASVQARQYTPVLLQAGGKYVDGGPGTGRTLRPGAPAEFARAWHRAAVALLEGVRNGPAVEEHVAAIESRSRRDVASDPRLLLARGMAKESHCWLIRPSLDQPSLRVDALAKAAGVVVRDDLDGPTLAGREAMTRDHFACLSDALAQFDTARAEVDVRAEANVRGGWVLIQQARYQDALAWLDAAAPGSDRPLGYWRSLFRGRALGGLNRHSEAAEAYREAFTRYPGAQTAGLGLAFELQALDRDVEADQVARGVRATAVKAVDPWTTYLEGDGRFADEVVEALRRRIIQ